MIIVGFPQLPTFLSQELSALLARPDVDPNKLNPLGEGPLHTLAKRRDLKEGKKLDLLYTFLLGGELDEGSVDSMQFINVNLPDASGNTALHLAAGVSIVVQWK